MDSEIRTFQVTIAGPSLLMHNGAMADPLSEYAKLLKAETSKRKKSDDDHEKIAEIEFQGGMYFDEKLGPDGAKKKRLGTIFESCVRTASEVYKLEYKGPRTRDKIWADPKFRDRRGCGVQTSRVIRTRPKFTDWTLTFDVCLFPCELNPGNVEQAIVDAGTYYGIGDFRPRFGLFTVKRFEEVKKAAFGVVQQVRPVATRVYVATRIRAATARMWPGKERRGKAWSGVVWSGKGRPAAARAHDGSA